MDKIPVTKELGKVIYDKDSLFDHPLRPLLDTAYKNCRFSPSYAQLVGAQSCTPKGCVFHF